MSDKKRNIASMVWGHRSQLNVVQAQTIEELGHNHTVFEFNESIPDNTEIVFLQGPYGPLSPLIQQLSNHPPQRRPVFVYWFQQSLDFRRPEWLRMFLAKRFSELSHNRKNLDIDPKSFGSVPTKSMRSRGTRLGYLGDLLWLKQNNLLDVLALSSTIYADYLHSLGIDSVIVPRGYHPSYGKQLNLKRDIPLVWMGKMRTRRRRKILINLFSEMKKHGKEMKIFDGVNNPFIFGETRTEILNRTWFVANVFFSGPTDELSIRFFISGANGAVIITEPGLNKYPFIPGTHLVEAPVSEMTDKILYYLDHPHEWQEISHNMRSLIQNELTLRKSINQLLDRADEILSQRE
jgi:Glycosyl transferases group 1